MFVIVMTRQVITLRVEMSYDFSHNFVTCRVAHNFFFLLNFRRVKSYIFIDKRVGFAAFMQAFFTSVLFQEWFLF
jgi:hypothetical protein